MSSRRAGENGGNFAGVLLSTFKGFFRRCGPTHEGYRPPQEIYPQTPMKLVLPSKSGGTRLTLPGKTCPDGSDSTEHIEDLTDLAGQQTSREEEFRVRGELLVPPRSPFDIPDPGHLGIDLTSNDIPDNSLPPLRKSLPRQIVDVELARQPQPSLRELTHPDELMTEMPVPLNFAIQPHQKLVRLGVTTEADLERKVQKLEASRVIEGQIRMRDVKLLLLKGKPIKLGEGGYGQVYRGRLFNEDCAIKIIHGGSDREQKRFLREINTLRNLRSQFITRFMGFSVTPDGLLLCMEYVPGSTLFQSLKRCDDQLYYNKGRKTMLGVAVALGVLHGHGIVHLDLTSNNILLTEAGEPRVSDCGLSKLEHQNAPMLSQMTTWYSASPEVLSGRYSTASDIYSFGCVLHEVCTGEVPNIKRWRRPVLVPDEAPQQVVDLMDRCLMQDGSARPTADELYKLLMKCPAELVSYRPVVNEEIARAPISAQQERLYGYYFDDAPPEYNFGQASRAHQYPTAELCNASRQPEPVVNEEEARAPISAQQERLYGYYHDDVPPQYNFGQASRAQQYPTAELFDAFRQPEAPNRFRESLSDPRQQEINALQSLYQPPTALLLNCHSLPQGIAEARRRDRWLVMNLQSDKEFASYRLNRDTWADPIVHSIISNNFVLTQWNVDSEEGLKIQNKYNLFSLPAIVVIDPMTGSAMTSLAGFQPAETLMQDLVEYLEMSPSHPDSQRLRSEHRARQQRVPPFLSVVFPSPCPPVDRVQQVPDSPWT